MSGSRNTFIDKSGRELHWTTVHRKKESPEDIAWLKARQAAREKEKADQEEAEKMRREDNRMMGDEGLNEVKPR